MGKNRRRNWAPRQAAAASNSNVTWLPKGQHAVAHDDPSNIERLAAELMNAVTSQMNRLKEELHASEQANTKLQAEYDELAQKAASDSEKVRGVLSEQVRAIQAEKDELKVQLAGALARSSCVQGSQRSHQTGFCGVEWCFECRPGEWTSLPADRSDVLQKHYQDFKGGGEAVVRMHSGVEEYTFDFGTMTQTNTRTSRSRAIKGQLHAPSNWTRHVCLDSISKATEMECFELSGFESVGVPCLNGTYVSSSLHKYGGHDCWWDLLGNNVICEAGGSLVINVVSEGYGERVSRVAKGVFTCAAKCEGIVHPGRAINGWEVMRPDGRWKECSMVNIAATRLCSTLPLMEVAVELFDTPTLCSFCKLFQDSVIHATQHHGASRCHDFQRNVNVVRVLRIENWHLWTKYRTHLEQVKGDLSKLGVSVESVEPALPAALSNLPAQCGVLDAGGGLHMLFHGTTHEIAVKIALGGFDFRLSKPGFYGQGTYFGSQACKTHQYTQKEGNGLHTMIVSRVILGDMFYATRVNKEGKRPPPRAGTSRCYDSVVARPGPMLGHPKGEQTHQEFVIFDKFQAYPEFIVQYTCKA